MEFNVTAGIFHPFAMKREKKSPLWKTNYITLMNNAYKRKKENVLFNNTLFTFYLMLYGEHYGKKTHSGSELGILYINAPSQTG